MRTWRRILVCAVVLGTLAVACSPALARGGWSSDQPSRPSAHQAASSLTAAAPGSVSSSSSSTTSSSASTSSTATSGDALPNTGIELWLAAALGLGMAGLGLAVRHALPVS